MTAVVVTTPCLNPAHGVRFHIAGSAALLALVSLRRRGGRGTALAAALLGFGAAAIPLAVMAAG